VLPIVPLAIFRADFALAGDSLWGVHLPRILIADDNSNIQRMASLALKDAGIEVIAVGNGEAAVRKMSEVLPDLVLADIFMPVRNGYELCEFVKHDPRYTNTPVLLLAGAFDPFDEQEAQRVQADGVLKKPFVPPDPLINAVRALLAKSAGDRLIAAAAPVTAAADAAKASASTAAAVAEPAPELDEAESETFAPLSVVDFGSGTKGKSSFSPTLDMPVAEPEEPEPVVTASRDPILGEPAFWVPDEEPEETPQATKDLTDHTWNSSRPVALRDDPTAVPELELAPKTPTAAPAFHELIPRERAPEPIAAAAPLQELAVADVVIPEMPPPTNPWGRSAPVEMEPADVSSVSQLAVGPLAVEASPILAPVPPTLEEVPATLAAAPPALAEIVPTPTPTPAAVDTAAEAEHATREVEEIPTLEWTKTFATFAPPVAKPIPEPAQPEEHKFPTLDWAKAFALPTAPVEPAPAAVKPQPEVAPAERAEEPEGEFAIDWPPTFIPVASSAVHEIRTPSLEIVPPPAVHAAPEGAEPARSEPEFAAVSPATAVSSLSPDAAEAVIQRVIERLQPQIVEMVTRDILRPLVEALVRGEIEK
jgi:CheY-like chemotaxis protein